MKPLSAMLAKKGSSALGICNSVGIWHILTLSFMPFLDNCVNLFQWCLIGLNGQYKLSFVETLERELITLFYSVRCSP